MFFYLCYRKKQHANETVLLRTRLRLIILEYVLYCTLIARFQFPHTYQPCTNWWNSWWHRRMSHCFHWYESSTDIRRSSLSYRFLHLKSKNINTINKKFIVQKKKVKYRTCLWIYLFNVKITSIYSFQKYQWISIKKRSKNDNCLESSLQHWILISLRSS